jgi:hypothetical protein
VARIYFDMGTLLQTITDSCDERKALVEALRTSERDFEPYYQRHPNVYPRVRAPRIVLYVNQAVLELHRSHSGRCAERGLSRSCFPPEDVERLREERREALTRPVPFENEQRVLVRTANIAGS